MTELNDELLKVLTPKQSNKVWSGFSLLCPAYLLNTL